ncbi:hypothetical protein TRIP_B350109 [uncultured Desulfatiglans sp.]|nr:hypothetical protein TRIP_B350109 [uncultured Desulfatiglans sp.]
MRNPNTFTERQLRFLEAIRERIRHINDPNPEIITDQSYEWLIGHTKQFGKIPKIKFFPNSCHIKAEIIESSGLIDEFQAPKKDEVRAKFSIKKARNTKANLFESEWNNIMLKAKKATFTLALMNQIFSNQDQKVSEPIALFQSIVMDEYAPLIKAQKEPIHPPETAKTAETPKNPGIKTYDQELAELE